MRTIDADALKYTQAYEPCGNGQYKAVNIIYETDIEAAPTIDAVPVTRCRDCKHRKAKMGDCYGNGLVLCNDGVWRDMDFFCADGERSEE